MGQFKRIQLRPAESFIGEKTTKNSRDETLWNDFCAVFVKDLALSHHYKKRILMHIVDCSNARCDDKSVKTKDEFLSDDFLMIKKFNQKNLNASVNNFRKNKLK